jgi:hypothetical protein
LLPPVWTTVVPAPAEGLTLVEIATGPTGDILVTDLAGPSTFEQHRWSAQGVPLGTHQDTSASYAGTRYASNVFLDADNNAFYGTLATGPAGENTALELAWTRVAPDGSVSFRQTYTGMVPTSMGLPTVRFLQAGGDAGTMLHGAFTMGAPEVLSSGVYCFAYDGQSLGASAQNVTEPLSSADFLWPTPDNGLVLFEPLATTTNLGCSTTLDAAGEGGVALARFSGGGECLWNKLLALPSAAVLETSFQVAHDGSFVAAVVHANAIDFGDGPLQPAGPSALALAHFDPSGSLLWAKSFGGVGATIKLGSMGLDPNGRILVTGTYAGSVDLGAGPLPAADDTLLAVFDASGNLVWSKSVTVGAQSVLRAAASDGAVVIATDSPEVDLGPGQLATVASIRVASIAVP